MLKHAISRVDVDGLYRRGDGCGVIARHGGDRDVEGVLVGWVWCDVM